LVYHDVVRNVLQKYPDAIKYEYRHFPLTGPHPNALAASLAAEAAGEQGRYWEMHDLLRSSQAEWRRKPEARRYFAGLAKQIGLDIAVFERSMDSSVVEEKILNDAKRAQAAGVEAVPRFYVDGQPLEGGYTPEALEAILLSMIRTRLGLGTN
jgi:protein-disulfide isomerase